jgi:hypothetical protein
MMILLSACKQEDLTPAWLKINNFTISTNESTQGANSHNITDAWLYVDGKNLGVYELPCIIPVLEEGEHTLSILPGIKVNGIQETRSPYPFYQTFEVLVDFSKNDTVILNPTTAYKTSVQFPFLEDFEGAGFDIIKGPNSDTNIVFISKAEQPDIVKYGDKCGGVFLSLTDSSYSGKTQSLLNLPRGQDVYLEIDYMCTNSMATGVIAQNSGGTNEHTPLVILNPSEDGEAVWKKIYINLKDDVSFETNATSYEFYLLSILDENSASGYIYLDNVKVVHY